MFEISGWFVEKMATAESGVTAASEEVTEAEPAAASTEVEGEMALANSSDPTEESGVESTAPAKADPESG
ncbi:hypothetical protein NDU88_001634 [Pleurodeles waltl]|uniref:Uncharacterized protein n=1 Tax=Pleurodeles waltl TaxID=8319 RepID=A0AAV7LBW2_PLEWA|nr:hypothetical protein NDU88_001634 [Pleurodeles waltl]